MRLLISCALVSSILHCGGEPVRPSREPAAPPIALAPPEPVRVPSALACERPPDAKSPPSPVTSTAPLAGQMSEAAAQAKRLFDRERWEESIPALRSVADGTTRDDDGNRQLADYHLAIAYFRTGRFAECAARL